MGMGEFFPPVVVKLLADAKEFNATFDEAGHKLEKFGAIGDTTGQKFANMGKKMTNAIGYGVVGAMALGIEKSYAFAESLDVIRQQSSASEEEVKRLHDQILNLSVDTATSTKDLVSAYLEVEKAGYRRAKADEVVKNAAIAAKITGTDVTSVTKTLIAVQELQVAQGMKVADVTDLIVNANKAHIGSVDQLTSALTGKVGASLAQYHVDLRTAMVTVNELSKAGISNSRQLLGFAKAIGTVQKPTKAMLATWQSLHLSAKQLTSMVGKPGGLINVLNYLDTVSKKTGESTASLASGVFGSAGSSAKILIDNVKNLTTSYTNLGGSAKDLAENFKTVTETPAFKLKQLENSIGKGLIKFGDFVLPAVKWAIDSANKFLTTVEHSTALKTLFGVTLGGALAYTVVSKVKSAVNAVKSLFGKSTEQIQNKIQQTAQTTLTDALVANTAATNANTTALGGEAAGVTATEATTAVTGAEVAGGVAGGTVGAVAGMVALPLAAVGGAALIINPQRLDTAKGQAALVKKFGADKAKEIDAYVKQQHDWRTATIDRFGNVQGNKVFYGRAGGAATALNEKNFGAGLKKITATVRVK